MKWFDKKYEKFDRLPSRLKVIHLFFKLLYGVGLGALITVYLRIIDWQLIGWLLILLLALVTAIIIIKFKKPFGSTSVARMLVRAIIFFGVGLGLILPEYLQNLNWQLIGWVLIISSIAITIPKKWGF
jgi:uncharacterized membrane protein AbrB (regulator of aidB expression)